MTDVSGPLVTGRCPVPRGPLSSVVQAAVYLDEQTVEDEFAYIVWHAETPDNVYEFATDTFHIPDDEIVFQTFAGKVSPRG